IRTKTVIGFGSPNKAGTHKAHGEPLGVEEVKLTKKNLGWPYEEPFTVPEEALENFRKAIPHGGELEQAWEKRLAAYAEEYPDLATQWREWASGELPAGWADKVPQFEAGQQMATREASGKTLNALAAALPMIVGGSADLRSSNNTFLQGYTEFSREERSGRNLNFGVREHAMGSVMNGIALTRPLIPYGGTFLVFSDYMRPPVRLAAMMGIQTIYVYTHDSIGLGEDGPTHQPVEHLASLRSVPNLTLIRPADANETAIAWRVALENRHGPTALALTRQKLPIYDRTKYGSAEGVAQGAYVLAEAEGGKIDLILIATGSEVSLAMETQALLSTDGINARVVSMPSWEMFERQSQAYRDEVLPPAIKARISIEAGVTLGWAKWVGDQGAVIGLDRFGASAPYQVLMEKFGFTPANIAARAKTMLGK
ncbi:MAG: transketolase, partial [Acidobacteriota bacterium]